MSAGGSETLGIAKCIKRKMRAIPVKRQAASGIDIQSEAGDIKTEARAANLSGAAQRERAENQVRAKPVHCWRERPVGLAG